MTYDMLGLFTFDEVNANDFDITFQIPDNCNYDFTESNGIYTIAIKLNPGETQPSTTFIPFKETAAILNKSLITNFEQHQKSGVIIKKPVVNIGF
ncbi:hypothetical protein [Flavobacterium sp.]|uniref:hypothetical protein n=1 Tax=Flavobacterium sp. TaxID=239 RepID=UPI00374C927F